MNYSELEDRLGRLDRRIKRYQFITASFGAAILGLLGIAATSSKDISDEIRAKRLVIVSNEGKESMLLAAGKQGGALVIFDDGSHPMFIAESEETGANLVMKARNGKDFLRASPEGAGGELTVVDKSGKKNSIGAEASK